MKIGIICASDEEVKPFLSLLEHEKVTYKSMLSFHEGKIHGIDVVTLFCGVCKVNAAIASQILIDTFHCTALINAGTAGGIDNNVQLYDIIVATEITYHDVDEEILTDFHPWLSSPYFQSHEQLLKYAKKTAQELNFEYEIHFGRMVTGEQFVENKERENIIKMYHPLSVDMETASIAHVCYVNETPFIAIRAITDTLTNPGIPTFETNCQKASQISAQFVNNMLRLIKTTI